MTHTSRRSILAGLAVASVAAAPAMAAVATEADPIFALLAECARQRAISDHVYETQFRPAERAWFGDKIDPAITNKFREVEAVWNAANDGRWAAEVGVLNATPTTLAGAIAQMQFGADYLKDCQGWCNWEDTHALISNVATFLACRA